MINRKDGERLLPKKLTYEEVKQWVDENTECELLSTDYVNCDSKLTFRCYCGEIFARSLYHFKNRGQVTCRSCSNKKLSYLNRMSFPEVCSRAKQVGAPCVDTAENYINQRSILKFSCKRCSAEFKRTVSAVINGSQVNCASCACIASNENSSTTLNTFLGRLSNIHEGRISLLSCYGGITKKAFFRCNKCKHVFEKMAGLLVNQKTGCPYCVFSKGEILIENYLQDAEITHYAQKRFADCRNISTLPFDFYLPDHNICIEYDGIQHFEPIDYFGGQESFERQQQNDRIKDQYCSSNGIKLIRIPYWEQDNIESILDKELQKYLPVPLAS